MTTINVERSLYDERVKLLILRDDKISEMSFDTAADAYYWVMARYQREPESKKLETIQVWRYEGLIE